MESSDESLKRNIEAILKEWEERARKEVPAAVGQTTLLLRNSLPQLLKSLVILLSAKKRTSAQIEFDLAESVRHSKEHGRGRAGVPSYIMSQVIFEYHILREVILKKLEESGPLSQVDRDIIHNTIESAVNVAATEFTLALKEMQDQIMLSLAHDLKTPLTTAQLSAELIRKNPKADNVVSLSEQLISEMKRISDMIERLLDTSRISAGEALNFPLSQCDLSEIARDIVSTHNMINGENCRLSSATLPVVGLWNQEYLRRMIENLVNNAFKFRSPNTIITVSLKQTNETATIEVHNLGKSIPNEERAGLFQRFNRGTIAVNQKGWGLGLTLVKGVVDALHGTASVESTEEKGTSFIIELPKNVKSAKSAA